MQIGVRRQFTLYQCTLGAADCRQIVVSDKCLLDLRGADPHRCHALGFEPDPHSESTGTEDLDALHAGDCGQARLHHPGEIVGDLFL